VVEGFRFETRGAIAVNLALVLILPQGGKKLEEAD